MTRNQHQVTSTFPEVAEALAAQATEECVVDGEIVAFDGSETKFERLQQRLGLASPGADLIASVPVYYYVFDVLHAGGRDIRPLPLTERKQVLRAAWRSRAHSGSPSTGTPRARPTTPRRAVMAGKASSPSGPTPRTAAGGPRTG